MSVTLLVVTADFCYNPVRPMVDSYANSWQVSLAIWLVP